MSNESARFIGLAVGDIVRDEGLYQQDARYRITEIVPVVDIDEATRAIAGILPGECVVRISCNEGDHWKAKIRDLYLVRRGEVWLQVPLWWGPGETRDLLTKRLESWTRTGGRAGMLIPGEFHRPAVAPLQLDLFATTPTSRNP